MLLDLNLDRRPHDIPKAVIIDAPRCANGTEPKIGTKFDGAGLRLACRVEGADGSMAGEWRTD